MRPRGIVVAHVLIAPILLRLLLGFARFQQLKQRLIVRLQRVGGRGQLQRHSLLKVQKPGKLRVPPPEFQKIRRERAQADQHGQRRGI